MCIRDRYVSHVIDFGLSSLPRSNNRNKKTETKKQKQKAFIEVGLKSTLLISVNNKLGICDRPYEKGAQGEKVIFEKNDKT